jgi:hypothetical protein
LLPAPTVETINILNSEFIPGRVISARSIEVYRLTSCQHPDEARHLRGSRAIVDLELAESLACRLMNIEPKNAASDTCTPCTHATEGPSPPVMTTADPVRISGSSDTVSALRSTRIELYSPRNKVSPRPKRSRVRPLAVRTSEFSGRTLSSLSEDCPPMSTLPSMYVIATRGGDPLRESR